MSSADSGRPDGDDAWCEEKSRYVIRRLLVREVPDSRHPLDAQQSAEWRQCLELGHIRPAWMGNVSEQDRHGNMNARDERRDRIRLLGGAQSNRERHDPIDAVEHRLRVGSLRFGIEPFAATGI